MTTSANSISSISAFRNAFQLATDSSAGGAADAHDTGVAGFAHSLGLASAGEPGPDTAAAEASPSPEQQVDSEPDATDEKSSEECSEQEGEAHEEGDRTPAHAGEAQATAAVIAGLPLTIHALNERLLQASSAPMKAAAPGRGEQAGAPPRADAGREGDPVKAADSPPPIQQSVETAGTSGRAGAAPATGPLDALSRAAENAQVASRAAQSARAGQEGAPPAAPAAPGVNAIAAGASGAARPLVVREVRPVSQGLPSSSPAPGGPQAVRTEGSKLRPTLPPPTSATTKERVEAFQAQVARAMVAAIEKGRGTLTLRLRPEALGNLHIKLSMKDGAVKAEFEAESAQARDLLNTSTGELRRSLEAAGLSVERIDASVSPHLRDQATATMDARFEAPSDQGSAGNGEGAPGRNESGLQSDRRGTDAAHTDADGAAEPLADGGSGGVAWLVMGVDTIA